MIVILDGMLILGENRVLPALVAFGCPILAVIGVSYKSFAKL
jgi:hypothetical protein